MLKNDKSKVLVVDMGQDLDRNASRAEKFNRTRSTMNENPKRVWRITESGCGLVCASSERCVCNN